MKHLKLYENFKTKTQFHNFEYQDLGDYFDFIYNKNGDDTLEQYREEYKYDIAGSGVEIPDDDDEINESDDFKKWLAYELEYTFDKVKRKIMNHFDFEKINIWRAMTVDNKWFENIKKKDNISLGIYWSYLEEQAEAHWGYNTDGKNISIIIKSSVTEKQINIKKTLMSNLHYSLGNDESEIRLIEGTPLKIEGLVIENKKIKSIFKNKIYKA